MVDIFTLFFIFYLLSVGRRFRVKRSGFQSIINVNTRPCINGGIPLLGFCELSAFPIGKALRFTNFLLKQDGINFLQTDIGDMEITHHFLQFHKSGRSELEHLVHLPKIILKRETDFQARSVGKIIGKCLRYANLIHTKQKTNIGS